MNKKTSVPSEWLSPRGAKFFFWEGKKSHGFQIELVGGDGKGWHDTIIGEDFVFDQPQTTSTFLLALVAHAYRDVGMSVSWYCCRQGVHCRISDFSSSFIKDESGRINLTVRGWVRCEAEDMGLSDFQIEVTTSVEFC